MIPLRNEFIVINEHSAPMNANRLQQLKDAGFDDFVGEITRLRDAASFCLSFVQAKDRDRPRNDPDITGDMVLVRLSGLCALVEALQPGARDNVLQNSMAQGGAFEVAVKAVGVTPPSSARSPQRIVCAAVRCPGGVTLVGPRHYDSVMQEQFRREGLRCSEDKCEQGFLDQFGDFLNRREALAVALVAGQVREKTSPKDLLFSEDLY